MISGCGVTEIFSSSLLSEEMMIVSGELDRFIVGEAGGLEK